MIERLEVLVSGAVQGVAYRDFATRSARRLGLLGEVENLSDGSVRVVAEGERGKLDAFINELAQGPFYAEVESVTPAFMKATNEYRSFDIVRGGG